MRAPTLTHVWSETLMKRNVYFGTLVNAWNRLEEIESANISIGSRCNANSIPCPFAWCQGNKI